MLCIDSHTNETKNAIKIQPRLIGFAKLHNHFADSLIRVINVTLWSLNVYPNAIYIYEKKTTNYQTVLNNYICQKPNSILYY